jgi:hypothetical protein
VLAFSGADGAAQPANEWVDARQAQAQHDKLLAQP